MPLNAVCTRAKTSVPKMLSTTKTTTSKAGQKYTGVANGSACDSTWFMRISSPGTPNRAGVT